MKLREALAERPGAQRRLDVRSSDYTEASLTATTVGGNPVALDLAKLHEP